MQYYLHVWRHYADFRGRARRKEYWLFTLLNFLFAMLALILDQVFGTSLIDLPLMPFFPGYIYILYLFASVIPSLAVAVRRIHDTGKSGWFLFISLIPILGGIWLLVILCMEGTTGSNMYGPDPKEAEVSIETGNS